MCNSLTSVFLLTGSVELIKSSFESFMTCIDAIFRVTVDRSNILVENFALVLLAQSEMMLDLVVVEPTRRIRSIFSYNNCKLVEK